MKVSRKTVIFISLLLIGFILSCNIPVPPQATPTPAFVTRTPEPILPTETPLPTATATFANLEPTPTLELAPICQEGMVAATPSSCNAAIAEQTTTYCKNKLPYNQILINKDATYQVEGRNVRCFENGTMKDGRKILICTGNMATSFQVMACDPTCVIATAAATSNNCPPEFNFNYQLGCCTQGIQAAQPNCVTLKLETIRCKIDCSVYTTKKLCENNSIACVWNANKKVCQPR